MSRDWGWLLQLSIPELRQELERARAQIERTPTEAIDWTSDDDIFMYKMMIMKALCRREYWNPLDAEYTEYCSERQRIDRGM